MLDRKDLVFLAALVLATLLIYGYVISWLLSNWVLNPYLNYGIIVPFLSLYIVYRQRQALAKIKRQYDSLGIWFVAAALIIYPVAVFLVKWLSLYLFIIGNMIILYGRKRVKLISAPLLFLLLATPLPDFVLEFIGMGLRQLSVGLAIGIIGILTPVSIAGDTVYLGDTSFYIGMPCSGIESFLGFGIFAVFFAYLFERGNRRLILISSCLVATVLLNALRMFIIFYVAVLLGEAIAMQVFHILSGMVLVGVYTIILLFIYRRRI